MFRAVCTLCALPALAAPMFSAEPAGKIVRPAAGSWLREGKIDIAATAPGGRLLLDGVALDAEEPFPNVFRAPIDAAPGEHVITLEWPGGKREARIHVGPSAPQGFREFVAHPPAAAACASCHALSRRGRFRFSGGCFGCHAKEGFAKVHSHEPHVLESCGLCHNAHGSTAAKHLLLSREQACKQCHN